METILKTLANYYILFIFLALLGIFAIIGYFIEKKHPLEKPKAPEIDMEAVAKKGAQGLGVTVGQNPIMVGEEVEQLDMTVQPTTFVNTSSQTVNNQDFVTNSNEANHTNVNNVSTNTFIRNDANNLTNENDVTKMNNANNLNNTSNQVNQNNVIDTNNLNSQDNTNNLSNQNPTDNINSDSNINSNSNELLNVNNTQI